MHVKSGMLCVLLLQIHQAGQTCGPCKFRMCLVNSGHTHSENDGDIDCNKQILQIAADPCMVYLLLPFAG